MQASAFVSGTGENIGSRSETIAVSNVGATLNWYTESICSANRDTTQYPNVSSYVIPLSRTYRQVLEVELLSSDIPRSQYIIECAENGVPGNNCFRFGEGYIIDNGKFGLCNNKLTIREYGNPTTLMTCGQEPVISEVFFPQTLTEICSITKCSDCTIKVVTACPHEYTSKYNKKISIVDSVLDGVINVNGAYEIVQVVNDCTIIARASKCGGPNLTSKPTESLSGSNNSSQCDCPVSLLCPGWVMIDRVSGPHELAVMVQDYVNERTCPPVSNAYSVCFNDKTGRFVFTRAFGIALFDVLASDCHSIMPTMGFSAVDYFYGTWDHQNIQQTRLPSDMLSNQIRPDIVSQTVGESALVCIERGNYNPTTLACQLSKEMNRPLIEKGKNDLLVVQILGQVVEITVPQGLYSPELLIEAIAKEMDCAYRLIADSCRNDTTSITTITTNCCNNNHHSQIFQGLYDLEMGAYCIESLDGSVFGLLFSYSTISDVIGFDRIDMLGSCCYQSLHCIFYPVMNRRFTDQMYKVVSEPNDSTFRFVKVGTFQAPVIKVVPCRNNNNNESQTLSTTCGDDCGKLIVHTWTKECGGAAHGFAPGDIAVFDGVDGCIPITEPGLLGKHVVEKVCDAFSFQISGKLLAPESVHGDDDDYCSSSSCDKKKLPKLVVAHQIHPFFLLFPGVCNPIGVILGFPCCVSNRYDYQGPEQWDFQRCHSIFLNINEFADTENGRISKSSNSGGQSKYMYQTLNSFVRIPNNQGNDFGLLQSSSFARRKRFLFNSETLSNLTIKLVDFAGNLINFHGRDHILEIRILTEQ